MAFWRIRLKFTRRSYLRERDKNLTFQQRRNLKIWASLSTTNLLLQQDIYDHVVDDSDDEEEEKEEENLDEVVPQSTDSKAVL